MILDLYTDTLSEFDAVKLKELNQLKLMKRVDTKYVIPISLLPVLLNKAKAHYQLLEINNERNFEYYTSYFDTPSLDFYNNHQNQRLNRYKIRTRSYLVNQLTFIEVKKKSNKGQTEKFRKPIEGIHEINESQYKFLETVVPLNGEKLIKSSENNFRRITLASFSSGERITIDYGLSFKNNTNQHTLSHIGIIEIKRDRLAGASPMAKLLKEYHVYKRGFSKYCIGMAYLHPEIKQNSFKGTKLYLKKLNYDIPTN